MPSTPAAYKGWGDFFFAELRRDAFANIDGVFKPERPGQILFRDRQKEAGRML